MNGERLCVSLPSPPAVCADALVCETHVRRGACVCRPQAMLTNRAPAPGWGGGRGQMQARPRAQGPQAHPGRARTTATRAHRPTRRHQKIPWQPPGNSPSSRREKRQVAHDGVCLGCARPAAARLSSRSSPPLSPLSPYLFLSLFLYLRARTTGLNRKP